MHGAILSWHKLRFEKIPSVVIVTTSPGSTSLINSASTASSAQLSEARTYELSRLPIHNG